MKILRNLLLLLGLVMLVGMASFILFRWEYHSKVQIAKVTQVQNADGVFQIQDVFTHTVDLYPSATAQPFRSLFE